MNMNANYLLMDELDYELYIRSSIIEAKADVKRSILRGILIAEQNSSFSYPDVAIDFVEKQRICGSKLNILEGMLLILNSDNCHPDCKRILRLLHAHYRISKIPDDENFFQIKMKLKTKFALLLDNLEQKAESNNNHLNSLIDLYIANLPDNAPEEGENVLDNDFLETRHQTINPEVNPIVQKYHPSIMEKIPNNYRVFSSVCMNFSTLDKPFKIRPPRQNIICIGNFLDTRLTKLNKNQSQHLITIISHQMLLTLMLHKDI